MRQVTKGEQIAGDLIFPWEAEQMALGRGPARWTWIEEKVSVEK